MPVAAANCVVSGSSNSGLIVNVRLSESSRYWFVLNPALENHTISHRHAQTITYAIATRGPMTVIEPSTANGSTMKKPPQITGCIVATNAAIRCGSRRMPCRFVSQVRSESARSVLVEGISDHSRDIELAVVVQLREIEEKAHDFSRVEDVDISPFSYSNHRK